MSHSLGKLLPEKVSQDLDFNNRKRENSAILLLTVDPEGYPHVALLSPYQVVVSKTGSLYMAVHKGTRTQVSIEKGGTCTLVLQAAPGVFYMKFKTRAVRGWDQDVNEVLYFLDLRETLEDVSEMAPFISELRFEVKNISEKYQGGFEKIREYVLSHP